MLFSLIQYHYTGQSAATDTQQCDPQHHVAAVSRLRSLRIVRQFSRYGVSLLDLFGYCGTAVILIATFTVPVLDIAFGLLGGCLCIDMLEISVIVCVDLAISFAADFAYCFIFTGCLAARMVRDRLAAVVADMVSIGVRVRTSISAFAAHAV